MPEVVRRTHPLPRRVGRRPRRARIDRTRLSARPERENDHAEHQRPAAAPEHRTPESEPRAEAQATARVLVVDDEPSIRLLCRVNLGLAGFQTLEAEDGETALAIARSERPDLILLDVMLPGVDGWDVAEDLRRTPETGDIPIVFLTARSDPADERRGYAVGGLGYITKPFDPERIADEVRDVLERVQRGEAETLRAERLASLGDAADS